MAFAYRGDARHLIAHPIAGHGDGLTYGAAVLPGPFRPLHVIFADGDGWEHVSVSTKGRPPNWDEMCYVKDLFWDAEDTVLQFHPPRSSYVNQHANCLHLWRPAGVNVTLPPTIMV